MQKIQQDITYLNMLQYKSKKLLIFNQKAQQIFKTQNKGKRKQIERRGIPRSTSLLISQYKGYPESLVLPGL